MAVRIDICNRALMHIGADVLPSENAPGADHVLASYEAVKAVVFGTKPWRFARRTVQLSVDADLSSPFWDRAYRFPAGRVGLPVAYYAIPRARPITDYELGDGVVWCNATHLWCRYIADVPPNQWPPLFAECVRMALAAELAMVIRDDADLSRQLRSLVFGNPAAPGDQGLIQKAALADLPSLP